MARQIVKTNLAVGAADLYTAPKNTTRPLDTVVYNGAFTNFVSIGGTEDGVTATFGRDTNEHRFEEDPIPGLITINTQTFSLGFSLAEDTLESMKLAYGGGTITTASGIRRFALSSTLEELALLLEARTPVGGHRRIYIPRAVATGEVGTSYRRSEGKRLYPVTLQALCAITEIDIAEFPAAV